MPRNGSGVYSKPAGTTAIADTTIESSKYNSTIDDLVADANAARPIVAGGTGATSASAARTALGVDPSRTFVTKSANYTAVAADKAANIRFDGAYTLSLTAAATLGSGWYCYVQADGGVVTIDPNASETINGAATLVLPDGYSTVVWCDGSTFRALEDFLRIDNWVDVASATTTDIGAVASQNVRITGTTTITGLGTVAAGTFRRVRFAASLTLTHNATSLILFGSNITTTAGDVGEFVSEGSGNWRCVSYTYATPAAEFNSSGSAPLYACRAWINFSGSTTTPTINASGNVTSITDNGTGDYTINFATAMPDANYAAVGSANGGTAGAFSTDGGAAAAVPTTTAFRFSIVNTANTRVDASRINVAFFR